MNNVSLTLAIWNLSKTKAPKLWKMMPSSWCPVKNCPWSWRQVACYNQLISISTGGMHPNILTRMDGIRYDKIWPWYLWYQYVSVWSPNLSVLLPWNILTGHWGGTLKGHRKADKDLSRAYQEFARIDYSDKEAAWRRWLLNTEIWAGDHRLIQRTVTIRNTDIGRLRGPSETSGVSVTKTKVG